jgi:hypothetical protein
MTLWPVAVAKVQAGFASSCRPLLSGELRMVAILSGSGHAAADVVILSVICLIQSNGGSA